MKQISILGSTGSIGTNTLKVVRSYPDKFKIKALAAHSNIELLEQQAREFRPEFIAVFDSAKAMELQKRLPFVEVAAGVEALEAAASFTGVDQVISAMTGTMGLRPTLAAVKSGKNVALANKEALVSGGSLVMSLVKEKGVALLPIDSEHSAIFQCLNGEDPQKVRRLILTASGGPFRSYTMEQLSAATVDQALCHPTWKMGPKVTIDCSTLMNKGLEVIEAHWLFNLPIDQIEVVIHPQSIIHSLVEFVDGSLIAQMGEPDMLIPIQYAMTYPNREKTPIKPFDFYKHSTLQFIEPDINRFRCLRLAFDAVKSGGSLPCYMNAANEELVGLCLQKKILWPQIGIKLEQLMSAHRVENITSVEDVLAVDERARREARQA